MSERGYGSESQAMPGETGPATQPYFLKPRNGAGVAALALGVLLTVRIGSTSRTTGLTSTTLRAA